MLGTSEFIAAALVGLLIWQFLKLRWSSQEFPPGPAPLPLIGGLWRLDLKLNQGSLTKIAKDYGNIFTLWVGQKPMIVLHGFHAVKEALITHSEELSGRPGTPFLAATIKGKGIMFASGHIWKQQRRFSLITLRNLGVGRRCLEQRVQEEAKHLVGFFACEGGQAMNPSFPIFHAVSNVISFMVFGHRFSYDDEKFQELVAAVNFMFHFMPSPFHIAYYLFPGLMHYLPGSHQKAFSCLAMGHDFIRSEIQNHKKTRDPIDPQDYIDYYLDQIEKSKDDSSSTFDEENLIHSVTDFFAAGTESTSLTLLWALLYMTVYPDVQEKVQKELQAILKPSEDITYDHRKKLPYVNAVIHEIQRFCSVLLVGSFRECVEDVTLQGFRIKKGTVVIPDVASVLYDPEQWETPHQFNPGHFLDKDGNFFSREAFIPFSIGNRACVGERLARTEVFIFFASLLRAFKFQLPEGVETISTDPVMGGLAIPPLPYKVCAVPY